MGSKSFNLSNKENLQPPVPSAREKENKKKGTLYGAQMKRFWLRVGSHQDETEKLFKLLGKKAGHRIGVDGKIERWNLPLVGTMILTIIALAYSPVEQQPWMDRMNVPGGDYKHDDDSEWRRI